MEGRVSQIALVRPIPKPPIPMFAELHMDLLHTLVLPRTNVTSCISRHVVHTKQSSMLPLNEKLPPMGPVQRFRNEMKAWFSRLVTVIERTASRKKVHASYVADRDRDEASVAKNASMGRLALYGCKNARGHPLLSGCPP
jgi:hypothetical protein